MEPEGSLPHSKQLASCSCPEPDRSSPCPSHCTSLRFILILPSHLGLGLQGGLFSSGFPIKPLLLSSYMLPALPISVFLFWSETLLRVQYFDMPVNFVTVSEGESPSSYVTVLTISLCLHVVVLPDSAWYSHNVWYWRVYFNNAGRFNLDS